MYDNKLLLPLPEKEERSYLVINCTTQEILPFTDSQHPDGKYIYHTFNDAERYAKHLAVTYEDASYAVIKVNLLFQLEVKTTVTKNMVKKTWIDNVWGSL